VQWTDVHGTSYVVERKRGLPAGLALSMHEC